MLEDMALMFLNQEFPYGVLEPCHIVLAPNATIISFCFWRSSQATPVSAMWTSSFSIVVIRAWPTIYPSPLFSVTSRQSEKTRIISIFCLAGASLHNLAHMAIGDLNSKLGRVKVGSS